LESIQARHENVEGDQIGLFLQDTLSRFAAVREADHVVPEHSPKRLKNCKFSSSSSTTSILSCIVHPRSRIDEEQVPEG
jgi:hypothetical protein